MSCPRCGDVCHCDSELHVQPRARSRPRFKVHAEESAGSSVLVDPDAYDASEEQFSASLENSADTATAERPKFVLDQASEPPAQPAVASDPAVADRTGPESKPPRTTEETSRIVSPTLSAAGVSVTEVQESPQLNETGTVGVEHNSLPAENFDPPPDSWKDEVAARLNSYRARRKPRPPKYPSLRLKFDPPENRTAVYASQSDPPAYLERSPLATYEHRAVASVVTTETEPVYTPPPETGRIIEFPRLYPNPAPPTYELAEPVMETPRIVEVPEVTPPPPALGGILLPAEDKEPEKRPGFEIPLQSAAMSRRVFAMAADGFIVLAACALFGYIVFKITGMISPSLTVLETAAIISAFFWAGYEYLLLIYTGSTPGLLLANLRLSHFDGTAVPRRMRKWRVLACVLSAASLGLGFAWSYLDEDALCWHDRITRTYLAPIK